MKTRKFMLTVAMIALFATATIGVNAQDAKPTPPPPPKYEKNVPPPPKMNRNMHRSPMRNREMTRQKPHWADLPNLTETQKKSIKKEKLKNMKAMTQLKNKIREKHAHLVTLLSSDDLDMKDVNTTIDQLGSLNSKMLKQQVTYHRAVRDQLTPNQKVIYDSRPKPFLRRER
ncbi:MAG: hypothetical protein H8E51_01095 [Bacteroidetes bacterium]|nr:hypothetical protein [Bacteroidota bacterium]